MISSFVSRVVILVFGTLFPAYYSYKAVKTKNVKEYVKWMMYWIVFAFFTCFETLTDLFLSFWFPFYYELKILVVLWLLSPATRGSSILYRKFVHPWLTRREEDIDQCIAQAKQQGYSTVIQLGTKGVNYATSVLVQTAIKGGGGLVNQLRRSYSSGELAEADLNRNVKALPHIPDNRLDDHHPHPTGTAPSHSCPSSTASLYSYPTATTSPISHHSHPSSTASLHSHPSTTASPLSDHTHPSGDFVLSHHSADPLLSHHSQPSVDPVLSHHSHPSADPLLSHHSQPSVDPVLSHHSHPSADPLLSHQDSDTLSHPDSDDKIPSPPMTRQRRRQQQLGVEAEAVTLLQGL